MGHSLLNAPGASRISEFGINFLAPRYMTNYAIRVTRPYEQIASWVASLALKCSKMVVVEHTERVSKVHCHLHVIGYDGHTDTITNTLEKALNIAKSDKENRGNKLISKKTEYGESGNKKPVDDANISYMSKGKYDPKYIMGYTMEEYQSFKEKGYDKKDYHEGVKESPDAIYYKQWEEKFHGVNQVWDDNDGCYKPASVVLDFLDIKNHAYAYSISKNQDIRNRQSLYKFQMLVWTYCYRHNIKIPKDETKWQY